MISILIALKYTIKFLSAAIILQVTQSNAINIANNFVTGFDKTCSWLTRTKAEIHFIA